MRLLKIPIMNLCQIILATSLFGGMIPAEAGLVPSATRLVYLADMKEKTLNIGSTHEFPVMVQAWVNEGDVTPPAQAKMPFVVYPPLFQLKPEHVQNLKVIAKIQQFPKDKESVYWLNLHEILPIDPNHRDDATQITLATTMQLKLIYRPESLASASESEIMTQLQNMTFQLLSKSKTAFEVIVHNPTPYSASFIGMALDTGQHTYQVTPLDDMMILPHNKKAYQFENVTGNVVVPITLKYVLIDGEGRTHAFSRTITGDRLIQN